MENIPLDMGRQGCENCFQSIQMSPRVLPIEIYIGAAGGILLGVLSLRCIAEIDKCITRLKHRYKYTYGVYYDGEDAYIRRRHRDSI